MCPLEGQCLGQSALSLLALSLSVTVSVSVSLIFSDPVSDFGLSFQGPFSTCLFLCPSRGAVPWVPPLLSSPAPAYLPPSTPEPHFLPSVVNSPTPQYSTIGLPSLEGCWHQLQTQAEAPTAAPSPSFFTSPQHTQVPYLLDCPGICLSPLLPFSLSSSLA